ESVIDRLGQARAALERRSGKRVMWADGSMTRPGQSAARLEADLLAAIDNDEIEILFQPQFSLPDDRLVGAEALARWQHPRLGRIGAGALFAVAERAEYVAPLSRHIAAKALGLAAQWPAGLRMSLNVTPADLAAESYADVLPGIVAASGFAPDRLTLEVTEQAMLADIALARRTLLAFAGMGMRIALDDFGAGFCNFRYLKLLPLNYLKLDRAMVDGIAEDERDLAVLRAIVAMAGALGLSVIAEGIEDEAQRLLVSAEGCAAWQGFLRAEPMGAGEFLGLAGG
ncbi:MAG: EAL domain-containing protein, partial [Novosphingobium sp.]